MVLITGCGKKSVESILNKIVDKIENTDSYYLTGELEMLNNETNYKYDVAVSYMKKNNFKVRLKNQVNNHKQVILRNNEGIFVITPSLNKSFKFQSEWPYNNSQAYLLQTLIQDIKSDKNIKLIKESKSEIIYKCLVNYINNKELIKQKIYLNNKGDLKKIEVLNKDNIVIIKMKFNKIEYDYKYKENYFTLDENITISKEIEFKNTIKDVIYPMYLPKNTKLKNQETIELEKGMRVILNFTGDSSFTLIQETAKNCELFETTIANGDPFLVVSVFGNIESNSINWINNGMEFYLVSDNLKDTELIKVAQSMNNANLVK